MSTKIYEGYRLAEGTDIWEFTERLRKLGNMRRDKLDLAILEEHAKENAEKRAAKGKEPSTTRSGYLMGGYMSFRKVAAIYDDEKIDPRRMSFTFIRDPGNGRILVRNYCGHLMEQVFTSQPEVEPYGYWDNTDPEEGVTEEEWAERRESWKRATDFGAPIHHGIGFDLRIDASDGMVELIYSEANHEPAING